MARTGWLIFALLAGAAPAVVLPGCDSKPEHSAVAPTTAPSTDSPSTDPTTARSGPTTAPADTQPLTSTLTIDGKPVSFPAAQIRVSRSNGFVLARLYSVDPKAALRDDYSGNSYDLQLHLTDIRDPQLIFTSQWQFASRSREYVDSTYGIFLNGMKQQLEPVNVSGKFFGDPFLVHFDFDGEFLQFETSDLSVPAKSVHVTGSVLAPVEYKD